MGTSKKPEVASGAERPAKRSARSGARTLKETFSKVLECEVTPDTAGELLQTIEGTDKLTADEAIAMALIGKAVRGDIPSAQFVRDTVGENPKDRAAKGEDSFRITVSLKK